MNEFFEIGMMWTCCFVASQSTERERGRGGGGARDYSSLVMYSFCVCLLCTFLSCSVVTTRSTSTPILFLFFLTVVQETRRVPVSSPDSVPARNRPPESLMRAQLADQQGEVRSVGRSSSRQRREQYEVVAASADDILQQCLLYAMETKVLP